MTNYFVLLGLPETLSLKSASVEESWRTLTRNEASTLLEPDLNQARATLVDPVSRLAHWLEIQAPDARIDRAIEPVLMDLFSEIGPVIKNTDDLLNRHRKATTALARAVLTREAIAAQLHIQQLLQKILALKTSLIGQFAALETDGKSGFFDEATKCLGQLKFLARWEEQCRERLLSLIAC